MSQDGDVVLYIRNVIRINEIIPFLVPGNFQHVAIIVDENGAVQYSEQLDIEKEDLLQGFWFLGIHLFILQISKTSILILITLLY